MSDDPVMLLERELLGAARRRATDEGEPPAPPGPPARVPPRRLPRLGLVAAVLAALIPVAAVIAAVALLSGRAPGRSAAHAGAPSLVRLLGVFRGSYGEAQPSVRHELLRFVTGAEPGASIVRVRRLEVPLYERDRQPNIIVFDLLLIRTAAGRQQLAVTTAPSHPARSLGPNIATPIYFGPRPFPTAATVAGRGVEAPIRTNTVSGSILIEVVPDGVSSVSLAAPEQSPLRVPVTHNVAAFDVRGMLFAETGGQATFTWYGAHGRIIRRVAPRATLIGMPSSASATGLRALEAMLPVLRRPQAAADVNPVIRGALTSAATRALDGRADARLLRLATVTPWGARVYLVPFAPAVRPWFTRGSLRPTLYDERTPGEGLGFLVGGQFGCCADPGMVKTGILVTSPHAGAPGLAGPGTEVLAIVPAGVARVVFGDGNGHRLSAAVHGDAAAARTSGRFVLAQVTMRWYDQAGGLIRRAP